MKNFLAIAVLLAATPAFAGEATITVPDSFKATMEQTRVAFERCLGATTLHTISDQCQGVANILSQLAALQPVPIKPPAAPSTDSTPAATPTPASPPSP